MLQTPRQLTLLFVLSSLLQGETQVRDWSSSPYYGWADKQMVMPTATKRICPMMSATDQCSCCEGAEIIKTHFRPAKDGSDGWDWYNPVQQK